MTRHLCLAVCAPGIEEICAAELAPLGLRVRRTFRGGVEFSATDRQLYAANLWSRTATRVVVRVARFTARTFEELERHAGEVSWDAWVPDGTAPVVRVSATSSRLGHTDAVAERLGAIVRRGPEPGPLVVARLIHDRVMLSVDSSGDPLYQRGWKRAPAAAPLRETLAAALLLASSWECRTALLDPMCGSGTVAVEAALMAAGVAPGRGRHFAFEHWPSFAPGTWASVRATPPPRDHPPIYASDRDATAVAATVANAERAGVDVSVRRVAIDAVTPPDGGTGWIVTNPPYGKRVAPDDGLYREFGRAVRDRFRGWNVALVVADDRDARATGIPLVEAARTRNGGIPVRIFTTRADTVAE